MNVTVAAMNEPIESIIIGKFIYEELMEINSHSITHVESWWSDNIAILVNIIVIKINNVVIVCWEYIGNGRKEEEWLVICYFIIFIN